MCKGQWKSLKFEVLVALDNVKCASSAASNINMLSASASKNSACGRKLSSMRPGKDFSIISQEICNRHLPHTLALCIYSFFNSSSHFGHMFLSKVCKGHWALYIDENFPMSNENDLKTQVIWSWHGWTLAKQQLTIISNVKTAEIAAVGVLLLYTIKAETDTAEDCVEVIGVYYSLRPFNESFYSELFSSITDSLWAIISRAIFSFEPRL